MQAVIRLSYQADSGQADQQRAPDLCGAGGDLGRVQVALMRGNAYLQAANADQACKVLIPAIEHALESPQT